MTGDRNGLATIKDIAESCKISRRTVSAILFPSEKNKHIGFSDATREQVLAASKTLRYRPNRGSRQLLERRQGVIGILTGQFFMIPWPSINGMLMKARSYHQVLSIEYLDPADHELPLFIRDYVVDGLVIYEHVPAAIERAIEHHQIPTVYVNTCRHDRSAAVTMDEAGAMRMAIQHLRSMGRQQPCLIQLADGLPLEQERLLAMRAACAEASTEAPLILVLADWYADRGRMKQRLRDFLIANPACDAVITPHGGVVTAVYDLCRQLGRRIPEEMSVICMQNPESLLDVDPPVTGFELPTYELGSRAVELLNLIIQGNKPPREILLPYQLHVRGSSRSAPP